MEKLIGGLFPTQESANLAYEALEKSGFAGEQINMFVHKPRRSAARSMNVDIQDIAKNAFFGALILGGLGAVLGLLVGLGIIPLPYLESATVPRDPLLVITSLVWGAIVGGLTGAILGVASKLLRSSEKAEVMTRQIEKRGVLVTVHAGDSQVETRARRIMEENGAEDVGRPSDKWDLDAWASPDETSPSLRNLANTR